MDFGVGIGGMELFCGDGVAGGFQLLFYWHACDMRDNTTNITRLSGVRHDLSRLWTEQKPLHSGFVVENTEAYFEYIAPRVGAFYARRMSRQ